MWWSGLFFSEDSFAEQHERINRNHKTLRHHLKDYFTYETPIASNLEVIEESAVEAFPIAILGFAMAFSVAKVYSVKHDYTIDGNQGVSMPSRMSNMFGASLRSFAASTALSRTAIQESTGGKTQIAGVLSAMMVLIVIVAIGFLLEPLPRSVLGALVIINLKGMLMQFRELPLLWKNDRPDFVNWNTELPANISVPPVNTHSFVLDFSAAYFFYIYLLSKSLKEFIQIEVDVYIVSCDVCSSWRNFIDVHFLMTRLRRPSFTPSYMMPFCTFWKCIQIFFMCVVMFAGCKHKLRSHSERRYNCVSKRRL